LSQSLELFPIGNCAASALIDEGGRFVWACAPRVDGDPFFSALLGGHQVGEDAHGLWAIELEGQAEVENGVSLQFPFSLGTPRPVTAASRTGPNMQTRSRIAAES